MIATIEYVKQKFNEFNTRIFAGHLPMPGIELCNAKTFLGQCKSRVKHLPDGSRQHYDFKLRFSTRFDLPQQEMDDTIIHEMIHYFIIYNGLHDSSVHGHLFKSLMKSINDAYGRHISISHRSTPEERNMTADTQRSWHVIAVVKLKRGRTGVKVLPRNPQKVVDFYRDMLTWDEVVSIGLHLHNHPYFNRFPTSTARKVHLVDADEVMKSLAGSHHLFVENGQLIQR